MASCNLWRSCFALSALAFAAAAFVAAALCASWVLLITELGSSGYRNDLLLFFLKRFSFSYLCHFEWGRACHFDRGEGQNLIYQLLHLSNRRGDLNSGIEQFGFNPGDERVNQYRFTLCALLCSSTITVQLNSSRLTVPVAVVI